MTPEILDMLADKGILALILGSAAISFLFVLRGILLRQEKRIDKQQETQETRIDAHQANFQKIIDMQMEQIKTGQLGLTEIQKCTVRAILELKTEIKGLRKGIPICSSCSHIQGKK